MSRSGSSASKGSKRTSKGASSKARKQRTKELSSTESKTSKGKAAQSTSSSQTPKGTEKRTVKHGDFKQTFDVDKTTPVKVRV